MSLGRFDARSKLLVRSLLSGVTGVQRALSVFSRQQRADPESNLSNFIDTLCGDEVAPDEDGQPVAVLPQTSGLHLIKCLRQDDHPSPWVSALIRQLEKNLGVHSPQSLYTPSCSQKLEGLSQRFVGFAETGGWATCFSGQKGQSKCQSESSLPELGTQRKRKGNHVILDSDDEETGQQSKRIKMDDCEKECLDAEEPRSKAEESGKLESDSPDETTPEELQPAADNPSDSLPQHIQFCALQMKELLDSQTEWDQSSKDMFIKVLIECDPSQVEELCRILRLSDLPEQTMLKLCTGVLALSPDLGYSTATTLIKSLLLKKVLSLSEPASRCLVTAVTSLCSHCPRSMCQALIRPVLEENTIGNPQVELLNRLIECCLDSHYRLMMLQMTFKLAWSEAVLSIIHSLLDSKPDLGEEMFTEFTEQLIFQGPKFTTSVKFAKILLTFLTKYSSYVTAAQKQPWHNCLMLNETFLKKPLQAALKRIKHS
ncbi:Fanconi anemia group E protein isoform X2 [Antennarius striatus]|uniref:Fanconi anemia group E protein isoform X2 n=1 Tax=Antennarius striatus TaxID=241820 RepID=UPI0035B36C21